MQCLSQIQNALYRSQAEVNSYQPIKLPPIRIGSGRGSGEGVLETPLRYDVTFWLLDIEEFLREEADTYCYRGISAF